MKSKGTNLTPEERKKLLAIVAEEEAALSEDISDEELLKEEELLSQQIASMVGYQSGEDDSVTNTSTKDKNWEDIKAKIGASEPSLKQAPQVVDLSQRRQSKKSQWTTILAVAAVLALFVYIGQNRSTPPEFDVNTATMKNTGGEVAITDCEYSFVGQEGDLPGNGLRFNISNPGPLSLRMTCRDTGYVHLRIQEDNNELVFINGLMADGFVSFNGQAWTAEVLEELSVSFWVTSGRLAQGVDLPQIDSDLVGQIHNSQVIWQDATKIVVARGNP